jgi:predicted alpha/beta superfamily hydrolase
MEHNISAELCIFYCYTQAGDDRPVYLTGCFNQWKTFDPKFKLENIGLGIYKLSIPINEIPIQQGEYLYTRGGWSDVERDKYGNKAPNRKWNSAAREYHDEVPRWAREGMAFGANFLPLRKILNQEYFIPQMNRTRRIQVLLPYNYDKTHVSYPVLYLQDGQNLFDKYAPFGTWALDEKLAIMAEKGFGEVIIVAIDHGGVNRIAEYSPYTVGSTTAEGRKYVKFITETLKPDIDSQFRTLKDRTQTGIGGSSMGGLISIYAGLMYPETYGKLMIFSPSLWVNKNIYFEAIRYSKTYDTKIYLYAGGKESQNMIPNVKRFKNALEGQGFDKNKIKFNVSLDPKGLHSESYWGAEFPKAAEWLFFDEHNSN